ncbi:MAG: aminotransferase class III-fold pyridoxal phosphate-dependent enzyme, partial [Pseudomonadales bacterium]
MVTTREIVDAYDNGGVTYFNTVGGNPVSCATGLAVLGVLKDERLQENALRMDNYLMAGLQRLQASYPVIADVRRL